ncbi:membrane protein [Streptomyces seoulensis]|nr:membrane protein [Streptomyces seoulensis]
MQLTRMHRVLIGVVVTGALIIAGIGFAGSYAAVRELAIQKGFGNFSYVFPIGIDAGICVLLALDLLLTWMRIPFPMLRQTAWLLTAATIAFNGAAAWPDPLGTGMHAVIPILFVVSVEAARHAVGRIADITADKHMEGVRLTRWMLSPLPTFLLWRRMKLWELRSYEQVIKLEQERLVYQARLRSRFGRAWRRKAPVESLMPLRLARYGVPLAETAPAGLAAAGIEPVLLPPAPEPAPGLPQPAPAALQAAPAPAPAEAPPARRTPGEQPPPQAPETEDENSPWFQTPPRDVDYHGGYDPAFDPGPDPQYFPEEQYGDWYDEQLPEQFQQPSPEETGSFPIPVGPGRTRELGEGGGPAEPDEEDLYQVFRQSIDGSYPTPLVFTDDVRATYGITLDKDSAKKLVEHFQERHNAEMEHTA